jgi:hypothetical protein
MKLLPFVIAAWLAMTGMVATQTSLPSSTSQSVIPNLSTIMVIPN